MSDDKNSEPKTEEDFLKIFEKESDQIEESLFEIEKACIPINIEPKELTDEEDRLLKAELNNKLESLDKMKKTTDEIIKLLKKEGYSK
jgi:hypothetical protein